MRRFIGGILTMALVLSLAGFAKAQDDVKGIIDKAIQALGGEAKLKMGTAVTWKANSKRVFGGNEREFKTTVTVQGLDRSRNEFEGEFDGNPFTGVIVLNGDKGWRLFGDNLQEMDEDAVANQKRRLYLEIVPVKMLPLKEKGFKVAAAEGEKVGDKETAAIKVTGPDGQDFILYFDKESGLPVKQVAQVIGFQGDEYTQVTTFANYKDFGGIKKATKVETTRDGELLAVQEITEFKLLDEVYPETFDEP